MYPLTKPSTGCARLLSRTYHHCERSVRLHGIGGSCLFAENNAGSIGNFTMSDWSSGIPRQTALAMPETVQSVVRSQRNGPLIAAAAQLWINDDDRVLDMTYGRGLFWTDYRPRRLFTNDLSLESEAEFHHDFRDFPAWSDGSFNVVVFDPPYIAQGGRDASTVPDMLDRYGLVDVPKTVAEVDDLIRAGMVEAVRLMGNGARLLVKCMDYVNGGEYVRGRHKVVSCAEELGLTQVDEFVHYSGTGPQPGGRRQLHSRRAHSFLCVFFKGRWI